MKEFIKKNFPILLAFVLPILLIVIVALTTYLPSLFISTKYNFVYTACTDGVNYYPYYCDNYSQKLYSVVDNKIVKNTINTTQDSNKGIVPDYNKNYTIRIFLHDTQKNESREITFADAQNLELNGLLTSPDGVTVSGDSSYSGGGFFLFDGGRSNYGYYLTKGRSKSKLNLINNNDQYYSQNNFQFLGWVIPGRN